MLEDNRALVPGNLDGLRKGRPRLVLVVATKRQQTGAAQAIDLRQIEADAGFVDPGDGALEMSEAIGRPAASKTSAATPR